MNQYCRRAAARSVMEDLLMSKRPPLQALSRKGKEALESMRAHRKIVKMMLKNQGKKPK